MLRLKSEPSVGQTESAIVTIQPWACAGTGRRKEKGQKVTRQKGKKDGKQHEKRKATQFVLCKPFGRLCPGWSLARKLGIARELPMMMFETCYRSFIQDIQAPVAAPRKKKNKSKQGLGFLKSEAVLSG